MDMTRKLSTASLLLVGTSLAAGHAHGTETDSELSKAFDEIIVRSSPLQSSIREIVLGTTVVGRDEILRDLDGTIGQTLSRQPGVSSTFFGPGASRPIIRGLGGDRIRMLSNDISSFDVSTSSGDHLVATDVATAEQIEILRGPNALLFGRGGTGGILNRVTKKGVIGQTFGGGQIALDTFGEVIVQGDINVQAGDKVAVRAREAARLMLLGGVHHMIEGWALDVLPAWLIDLSVAL